MKKPDLFYLLLVILLWGCAPYVVVGGKYTASTENFEVDLPDGWRKHELMWDQHQASKGMREDLQKRRDLSWDTIRVTRDGLLLQQIGIGRVAIDKDFSHTKRRLAKGMLPQEAADVIIDNIRSNPNISNQRFIENTPARVGGYPGFKIIYTCQTKEGVRIKGAYYGVIIGDWHYYILYEAPERYYFAKDYPAFEKLKDSFKILKADTV